MSRFYLVLIFIFLFVKCIYGQSVYDVKFITTPSTCNNADGGFTVGTFDGSPIDAFIKVYKMPDSTFIGNGPTQTGLVQGSYIAVFEYTGGSFERGVFITNFKPMINFDSLFLYSFIQSVTPDTCSQGKGHLEMGSRGAPSNFRDTLSLIQWTWSNGQTGLDVTGLVANVPYWVKGSLGNGCRYFVPPNQYLSDHDGVMYDLRTNEDTIFFKIHNGNSLDIGFTNPVRPLCNTPTGNLTALVNNVSTPPLTWKWNDGQTNQTAINLLQGTLSVRVTDAMGCEGYDYFYLESKLPANYTLNLSVLKSDSCLFGLGRAGVLVSGGFPPYKYYWQNKLSPVSSLKDSLKSGYNSFRVVDSIGCGLSDYVNILNVSTMFVNPVETQPNCLGTQGKIVLGVTGGTSPLSYHWDGYPENTTPTLDSILPGYYNWTVADANNCRVENYSYLTIPNSCYRSLKISVFKDENLNCVDNAEQPIYNNQISYKVLNTTFYSTEFEDYGYFSVLPGLQTIRILPKPFFNPGCLDSNWNLNGLIINPNISQNEKAVGLTSTIPLEKNLVSDLWVSAQSALRPGFITDFRLSIENAGNVQTENTHLELILPENMSFINSSLSYSVLSSNRIRMAIPGIGLGKISTSLLSLKVDSTVPISVNMPIQINLDTLPGETKLNENKQTFIFQTVGSFDPNDIAVTPSPIIAPDKTELEYRIRFQNVGTYYAENVVLKDTLPVELDLNTFRFVRSSHYGYKIEIKGRVLTVRFRGIYLPDSATNEKKSNGEFVFTIHRYPGLALGTRIENSASIYFDFNSPVKTNVSEVEVNEQLTSVNQPIFVYPNPASESFKIPGSPVVAAHLYDISGKKLSILKANDLNSFSLNGVSSGLYFLQIQTASGQKTVKILVCKE